MPAPTPPDPAGALEALGFTALEARIYVALLRGGPQTGYRIARHVGKAVANTYKALDELAQRGIVACEDGSARLYRATPYAEVSATLAGDFTRRAREASDALAALEGDRSDDRVYRVHGSAQIYERARTLLAAARSIAVVDAFPEALDELAPAIRDVASRGVDVSVHAYAPASLAGARVIVAPNGDAVRARWPGTWLNVSADGAAALVAHLLDEDRTVGVWTESPHVAWTIYCGLASETALVALAELAAREPSISLADALNSITAIVRHDVPGRVALASRMSKKKGRSS